MSRFGLVPGFVRDVLGAGPAALGLMTMAGGIGTIAGTCVVDAAGRRLRRGPVLLTALGAAGLALATLGVAPHLAIALGLAGLITMSMIIYHVTSMTLLQVLAPARMRGRVLAIFDLVRLGVVPLGSLAAGLLVPEIGVTRRLRGLRWPARDRRRRRHARLPAARRPRRSRARCCDRMCCWASRRRAESADYAAGGRRLPAGRDEPVQPRVLAEPDPRVDAPTHQRRGQARPPEPLPPRDRQDRQRRRRPMPGAPRLGDGPDIGDEPEIARREERGAGDGTTTIPNEHVPPGRFGVLERPAVQLPPGLDRAGIATSHTSGP